MLNHGELVVLLPVFHVSEVVVLTAQVKVPSVTCAEVDTCLLQQRCTEDGIDMSTPNKRDTQSAPLLLPLEYQH